MDSASLSAKEKDDPVVIVGMACRVPKAKNIDQFWDNLVNGVDSISKVPEDRWDADAFIKNNTISTTQGGFVSDIDKFDNTFFQIGPREAEVMDPQQRQILEVTYECLESAGIPKEKLKGSRTGVFAGVFSNDYKIIQYTDQQEIKQYTAIGGEYSIIANRISFCYDLKGPSLSIDTACSSSLVALHVAVQSIKSGECNSAFVCGVNALLAPQQFASLTKMNMLSPDGRCKPFDSSANGYPQNTLIIYIQKFDFFFKYARGEGFLALYIKPLSQALADGDPIRAIIHSTAVNQDGNKLGLTYPNKETQQDLLREIYLNGIVQPQDVQYVEAHGTGTPAGDPVEVGAIGQVIGLARDKSKSPLLIGSVKSNIGHLESASGLAGLIKTVIAMEKSMIPANLHFLSPNPKIDFSGMHLSVVSKLTPWPFCEIKRAGVNSFGFGGSNSHVLLEELVLPSVSASRATSGEYH